MNRYIIIFLLISVFSCSSSPVNNGNLRDNFTQEEIKIISLAKEMTSNCYYGTLITVDSKGQPKARVMEPFALDKNMEIWLATNPKSRKVSEIKNNSKATMHYFDKNNMGYVSFYGNAFIVNDDSIKSVKWKEGWERFYKNQKEDYMLIRFIPQSLELISISNGYTGDKETWKPHKVKLRD